MTRERLPNRRPSVTSCFRWPAENARRVHVTAGFEPGTGTIKEMFLRGGGRVGSEVDHLLDDIAVLVSRLLQHGESSEKIANDLGRLPDGRPASIAGAALDALQLLRNGR